MKGGPSLENVAETATVQASLELHRCDLQRASRSCSRGPGVPDAHACALGWRCVEKLRPSHRVLRPALEVPTQRGSHAAPFDIAQGVPS